MPTLIYSGKLLWMWRRKRVGKGGDVSSVIQLLEEKTFHMTSKGHQ